MITKTITKTLYKLGTNFVAYKKAIDNFANVDKINCTITEIDGLISKTLTFRIEGQEGDELAVNKLYDLIKAK